jgi:hypothetical protein
VLDGKSIAEALSSDATQKLGSSEIYKPFNEQLTDPEFQMGFMTRLAKAGVAVTDVTPREMLNAAPSGSRDLYIEPQKIPTRDL